MNLLLIEDESDFIDKLRAAANSDPDIVFVPGMDVGLNNAYDESGAIEEQLKKRLEKVCADNKIDLVLLDTDLSRYGNGTSQSVCRQALQELGVPVCRYSKKQTGTKIQDFERLSRLSSEGASAIWASVERIQDLQNKLFPWLKGISQGFSDINARLSRDTALVASKLGPVGTLAAILERPELEFDLLGYTGQNLFFFGVTPASDNADLIKREALSLGYWLFNYVLNFPGPLMSEGATSAYLNLQETSFANAQVQHLLADCKYKGPFANCFLIFHRSSVDNLLDTLDGDITTHESLKNIQLERVDTDAPNEPAYFCVVARKPIASGEAAPSPDWIPPGAQTARISQNIFDQLSPMLER